MELSLSRNRSDGKRETIILPIDNYSWELFDHCMSTICQERVFKRFDELIDLVFAGDRSSKALAEILALQHKLHEHDINVK